MKILHSMKTENNGIVISCIIDTKFFKPNVSNNDKKKGPINVCVTDFVNKGIDNIHRNNIFHCDSIVEKLPNILQTKENIPIPTMKLTKTIRN